MTRATELRSALRNYVHMLNTRATTLAALVSLYLYNRHIYIYYHCIHDPQYRSVTPGVWFLCVQPYVPNRAAEVIFRSDCTVFDTTHACKSVMYTCIGREYMT